VLSYWNFRLTREPGGALHVRRGLVTTRSVSLDEGRLRGVELKEPLPLRAVDGAWVVAVAGGLHKARSEGRGGGGGGVLLPPAPAARARRVAADVLGERDDPAGAALRRHPRTALPRRLTRAVGAVLVLAGVVFLLGRFGALPAWWWQPVLAASPLAALVGWDRYRNLGHAIVGRHLVCRSGSLRRRTVLLRRDGIIGWQLHRSFFQRRRGLITLVATVAAGRGAYAVVDVAEPDALALADEAVPGLLTPFLERAPG
jgi:putative membrane protein